MSKVTIQLYANYYSSVFLDGCVPTTYNSERVFVECEIRHTFFNRQTLTFTVDELTITLDNRGCGAIRGGMVVMTVGDLSYSLYFSNGDDTRIDTSECDIDTLKFFMNSETDHRTQGE